MRRIALFCLFGMALASCGRDEGGGTMFGGNSGSDLEQEAIARGLVVDAETSDPVGLYRRSHVSGEDALCLLSDSDDAYRFGVSISFGSDLFCEGVGTATRSGTQLRLIFNGAPGCSFSADYVGDAIRLPGAVPDACKALCSPRGTFAGAEMPRVGWDAASAAGAGAPLSRARNGEKLCAPGPSRQ